jgi:hypothetical protein
MNNSKLMSNPRLQIKKSPLLIWFNIQTKTSNRNNF